MKNNKKLINKTQLHNSIIEGEAMRISKTADKNHEELLRKHVLHRDPAMVKWLGTRKLDI